MAASPGLNGAVRIGVLALQGAFAAHQGALESLGASAPAIRQSSQLDDLDGLVMPGGESTTMSKLLDSSGLFDPLAERISSGLPVFGTCAGMILLAEGVEDGRPDQRSFGAIDIDVQRNGYGRQLASFEADLDIAAVAESAQAGWVEETLPAEQAPFRGVFIRAPKVTRVGDGVETLASWQGVPVLVRSGTVLAASFHPELAGDVRVHQLLVDAVSASV